MCTYSKIWDTRPFTTCTLSLPPAPLGFDLPAICSCLGQIPLDDVDKQSSSSGVTWMPTSTGLDAFLSSLGEGEGGLSTAFSKQRLPLHCFRLCSIKIRMSPNGKFIWHWPHVRRSWSPSGAPNVARSGSSSVRMASRGSAAGGRTQKNYCQNSLREVGEVGVGTVASVACTLPYRWAGQTFQNIQGNSKSYNRNSSNLKLHSGMLNHGTPTALGYTGTWETPWLSRISLKWKGQGGIKQTPGSKFSLAFSKKNTNKIKPVQLWPQESFPFTECCHFDRKTSLSAGLSVSEAKAARIWETLKTSIWVFSLCLCPEATSFFSHVQSME